MLPRRRTTCGSATSPRTPTRTAVGGSETPTSTRTRGSVPGRGRTCSRVRAPRRSTGPRPACRRAPICTGFRRRPTPTSTGPATWGAVENRGEITGLAAAPDPGTPGAVRLTWDASVNPAVVYGVYGSDGAPFSSDGGACLAAYLGTAWYVDAAPLPPGTARFLPGHRSRRRGRGPRSEKRRVSPSVVAELRRPVSARPVGARRTDRACGRRGPRDRAHPTRRPPGRGCGLRGRRRRS
jgi:hypothetical protein